MNSSELLIVENETKTLNFELLEERFGEELAKELKFDVQHENKNANEWDVDISKEFGNKYKISFYTYYMTTIYHVDIEKKVIRRTEQFSLTDAEKALKKMNALYQRKEGYNEPSCPA